MQLASLKVEAMVALDHVISVLKVQGSNLGHVIQGVCYCTSLEAVELAHKAWKEVSSYNIHSFAFIKVLIRLLILQYLVPLLIY